MSTPYPNKALIGIIKKNVDVLVLNDKVITKFLVLSIYISFGLFLSKIMHDILNLIFKIKLYICSSGKFNVL